jgi:hypothetical protein
MRAVDAEAAGVRACSFGGMALGAVGAALAVLYLNIEAAARRRER